MLHDTTITLFSRVRGTRTVPDTWERHILDGVKIETKTAMAVGTTGDAPAHYTLLLVPASAVGNLKYVTPEMYQAASDRSGLIAFQPGDYFCTGVHEWSGYEELCKVTECHRIVSYAWFCLIPHFEVIAS